MHSSIIECATGGTAASLACIVSNPLEVVKTRMQLQGELKASGTYVVHYRNVFHAFYNIGRVDGWTALQKGLAPGMVYQFFMNGLRLGTYQQLTDAGFTKDKNGNLTFARCLVGGAVSGCFAAFISSPAYMIKTQLQSKANSNTIAVGTQHQIDSIYSTFRSIYQSQGFKGLWRGASGSMLRVTFGSAAQLSSFSKCKEFIIRNEFFAKESIMVSIASSLLSSVVIVITMTPFDVVSTRLYNQPVCKKTGQGLIYNGVMDVFGKIFKSEGFSGLYKGLGPHYFRLGPHVVISLVLWDKFKQMIKERN